MLIRFSVENFMSFHKEVVFDLVANTSDTSHPTHLLTNKKKNSVLKSAAIYGANGAGKSNLIKAISFAKEFISNGTKPDEKINVIPFKLDKKSIKSPSKFEFIINNNNTIYTYGFSVSADSVKEEWLYAIFNTKEVLIFERLTNNNGETQVKIGQSLAKTRTKNHMFIEFIAKGTRPNQLLLYELYSKNVMVVKPVIEWFKTVLVIITPDVAYRDLIFEARENKKFIRFMGDYLKLADTGIDAITYEEYDDEKLLSDSSNANIKEFISGIKKNSRGLITGSDGSRFSFERKNDGKLVFLKLKMRHKINDKEYVDFEIEEESDGTRRLMDLLPALIHSTITEHVYIVDEIDRSMHPLLSKKFISSFFNTSKCQLNQLIITTHESNLLDLNLYRRDEIWFSEKDKNGSSHLFSLSEFKIRSDLKIQKGYLHGRFGAIPFLADIKDLGYCS